MQLEENTSMDESEKFEKNFAVALQKDDKGRIFQDVYRRIIWFSDMIDNFREFVWEKISEFLFTLNWDFSEQEKNLGNSCSTQPTLSPVVLKKRCFTKVTNTPKKSISKKTNSRSGPLSTNSSHSSPAHGIPTSSRPFLSSASNTVTTISFGV